MFLYKFLKCSQCINIAFFLQVTTTRSTASSAITGSSLLLAIAAPAVLIGRTRTAATCSDTASRPSRTNLSINFPADQCFNFLRLPYGIPAIQLVITFLIKPDDPILTILQRKAWIKSLQFLQCHWRQLATLILCLVLPFLSDQKS